MRLWIPSSSCQPNGNSYSMSKAALGVVRQLVRAVLVEARVGPAGCPSVWCHSQALAAFQYSNHSSSSPGSTKNCISICSNSRVRKMKLPGVISLRNAFPIWAMPNGSFWREACCTFRKLT